MTGTDAYDGARRHRLELRVGVPEADGLPDYSPVLRMLIDGQELLASAHPEPDGLYVGQRPAALLDGIAPAAAGSCAAPGRAVRGQLRVCGLLLYRGDHPRFRWPGDLERFPRVP